MFTYNEDLFEAFLNRDIIVDLSGDPKLAEEFIRMLSCNTPSILVSSMVHQIEYKCLCRSYGVLDFALAERADWFRSMMPKIPIVPVYYIITDEDNMDEKYTPLENDILLEIIMS